MHNLIINCEDCVMRATPACTDCVVTFVCDSSEHISDNRAVVFDLAEQRAVRLFAEAGLVPTLRHRAAAVNS
jgi:hypothetical protein